MNKYIFLSVFTIIISVLFLNRNFLLLRFYSWQQPCGIVFSDDYSIWTQEQKSGVSDACKIYQKSGAGWIFYLKPLFAFVNKGSGGAYATSDAIIFTMHSVDDPKIFKTTALHELAHVIDLRRGNLSAYLGWIQKTNWACSIVGNNTDCTHSCQQTTEKQFYCSYKDYEVLPSRFGAPVYDPEKADVSVSPSEDFAESARYYFEANDALQKTSPSRCEYMKGLFWKYAKDACFDCNPLTICPQNKISD